MASGGDTKPSAENNNAAPAAPPNGAAPVPPSGANPPPATPPPAGPANGADAASPAPPAKYTLPTDTSRKSRGRRSSTSRHRPKRAKEPMSFNEWNMADQKRYKEVTIELRRWKATQRQCQYIRQRSSYWHQIAGFAAKTGLNGTEVEMYKKTVANLKPIPAGESFDLPPLN